MIITKKSYIFFLDGQKWHLWKIQNFQLLLKMEIKVLKIDWGGKFLSNEFNTYFVLRQLMIIEMPHQNDVVEHLEKQNQFGKGQKHNNGN